MIRINEVEVGDAYQNLVRFYPETKAGGFSHCDGTVEFYTRINALIDDQMVVLDLGAGRGHQLEAAGQAAYRTQLSRLQGKVRHLVGVDVDSVVLENSFMDESIVVSQDEPLPFPDASFDLIYSDWVLEHVADPARFADEVLRLLKPSGWFCARTPNRWGMTGIAANLIPNRMHARLVARLQPGRQERDVFPTAYKLNTLHKIRRMFAAKQWRNHSYIHSPEPGYVQKNAAMFWLARLFVKFAPAGMGTNLHVFLQKPD